MLKCIWPQRGQGRLTKEMREKMKREVDLYDDFVSAEALKESAETLEQEEIEKQSTSLEDFTPKHDSNSGSDSPVQLKQQDSWEMVETHRNKRASFVNYTTDTQKDFVLLSSDVVVRDATLDLREDSDDEQVFNIDKSTSIEIAGEDFDKFDELKLSESPKVESEMERDSIKTETQLVRRGNSPTNGWLSIPDTPDGTPNIPSIDFFWEKLFDINFTDPIISPNFSIIPPTSVAPAVDEKEGLSLRTTASLMSINGSDDEGSIYGLDEEQTEKFYDKLMEKFDHWSSLSDGGKTASVDRLTSQYQFTENELLLYYTCVFYFLPAIGPQHTLPQLTTTETFVPLMSKHPIVKDVFLCCGATFLAWCQPQKYSHIAEHLYQKSKAHLQEEIVSQRIRGDETWAFACFQLLCLTDKLHGGHGASMVDRCVDNLAHSFNIIKRKIQRIREKGSTPTDRMLIESFMYNYTVSLLVARDLSKLPNPFSKIFHDLTILLKSPIFNDCDVEWMNNPVLGPSVDAFEMLAKVSYLSRMPLPLSSPEWIETAQALLEECLYYTPPSLPEEVRQNPAKYEKYRPGLLCGSIISKACYLLLSKILRFNEFNVKDFQIQGVVKYTVQSLKDIEKGNPLLCILLWSLLIIGAFTVDPDDRLVIKEYLKSTSETIHSYGALKISNLLQLIWERENINLLFVRENICQVII